MKYNDNLYQTQTRTLHGSKEFIPFVLYIFISHYQKVNTAEITPWKIWKLKNMWAQHKGVFKISCVLTDSYITVKDI